MNKKIRNIVKLIEENILNKYNIDKLQVFFKEGLFDDSKEVIYFEKGKDYTSFNGFYFASRKYQDVKILFSDKFTYLEIYGLTHNEKDYIRNCSFYLE